MYVTNAVTRLDDNLRSSPSNRSFPRADSVRAHDIHLPLPRIPSTVCDTNQLPDKHSGSNGGEVGLGLIGGFIFDVAAVVGLSTTFFFGILFGSLIKLTAKIRFWKFCIGLGILSLIPPLLEIL